MDCLLTASHERDINGLYLAIQEDPTILEKIDATPFINTPLHIAASAGHIEYAKEIARLKPSFARKPNPQGSTPMHVALDHYQTDMVSWLLDFNAELVRAEGREGVTPLLYVVERGELDLLKKFLSSCNMSIKDLTIRNETAFHLALKNDKVQAFDLLFENLKSLGLEEGARILNVQDLEGNTILHLATVANQDHVVQLLLRWHKSSLGKLQIGAVNQNGQTALEIATAHRHRRIERHLRASQNNYATICLLLKNGLNSAFRSWLGMGTSLFESVYGKSVSEKSRTDLLVVAALMASASFQVVLNPPGGLKDDGHAKLSENSTAYDLVMSSNTVAFIVSISTVLWLIGNFPMFLTLYVAVLAMTLTYYSSLAAITPGRMVTTLLDKVSLITPFLAFLMLHGSILSRGLLSRGEPKGRSASADKNL